MKSKKIVALIVAFAAFMAVATSGLAATTTTTYLGDKVTVSTTIAAQDGKEVTYLVKSGDQIVYIDQQTADGDSVTFEYKIDKLKLVDYASTVQFGTNGTAFDAAALENKDLLFDGVTVNSDAGVKAVTFHTEATCADASAVEFEKIGNGDNVWAKIELNDNYELATVTVNTVDVKDDGFIYKVAMGDTLAITTIANDVDPDVVIDNTIVQGGTATIVPDDENKTYVEDTSTYKVNDFTLKITGSPVNAGIVVDDDFFKAEFAPGETSYNPNKVYAVRIIDLAGNQINGDAVYDYGIEK